MNNEPTFSRTGNHRRSGISHLRGDAERDDMRRLQEVNADLLATCEEILRALTSPTRELLDSTRREMEPCKRLLEAAIEKAKGTT